MASARPRHTLLPRRGGTIVIHGRDRVRTEATRAEIRAASKNDDIHLLLADFASLGPGASAGHGISAEIRCIACVNQ